MDDVAYGKKLREMRTNAGKTVQEVSEYLKSVGHKAATQTIYGWERGHSQPTIDTFLEMCIYYGITDVLSCFDESEPKTKEPPSTAEAAPGEDVQELLEALDSSLVQMGYIGADDDLTEQQQEVLIGICGILRATFKKK